MACNLSAGRALPCKDVVGGIKTVYFARNFGVFGAFTITDNVITAFANSSVPIFKYDLKGENSFEQTINVSRATGTTFYEQTLTLTLTQLTKEDNEQLKLLAYGRPQVTVVDYNGNAFMMGLKYGADVSAGTIGTGTAMGDLSGYTMTLVAQENLAANFINQTGSNPTANNPFANMTSGTVSINP